MPLSLQDCTELLKNNKNLILTGAPGTGKTYLAKEIAKKLIFGDEGVDINNLNPRQKSIWEEQYKFVQFHPSYDYTDFVEGLRPTPPNANNQIGFKRENGVFKEFCKNAISNSSDNSQQNNQTNPQTPPPNNTKQTQKIEEALNKFLNDYITNKKGNNKAFKTKQGKQFHIDFYKNNIISIHKDEGQSEETFNIQMKAVLDFLIHIYKEDEKLNLDINLKKQGKWPLQRNIKKNDPINDIVSKDNEVRYYVWGICKRFFEEYFKQVGDIKLEDTTSIEDKKINNFSNIQKEKLKEIVINYIDKCIEKKITLTTLRKKEFKISRREENSFYRSSKKIDNGCSIDMVLDTLLYMYKNNLKKIALKGVIRNGKKTYNESYIAGFCNTFFNDPNNGVTENMSNDSSNPYFVFVIDEINRGEISKIFGELFFSIDPGYRGKEGIVQTQYQNMIDDETDPFKDGFYIPENVYIIGTMNDIDRSVESMDFAMRRRFAWQEIQAEDTQDMLNELGDKQQEAKNRMNNINNAIIDNYNYNNDTYKDIQIGLTPAYQIGASYFLKLENYLKDEKPFDSLWSYHIKGLLFEYLRGQEDADKKLEALHSAYELINQQENNEPNNNN